MIKVYTYPRSFAVYVADRVGLEATSYRHRGERQTLLYADVLDIGPGCWRHADLVVRGVALSLWVRRLGEYSEGSSKPSIERRVLRWPRRQRVVLSCGCSGFAP